MSCNNCRPIAVTFGILAFGFTLWSVGKCSGTILLVLELRSAESKEGSYINFV